MELPHELGVALGEHGLRDVRHGALFLPGRRVAGGVARQVHDAALPCGARVGVDDVWQVALLQVGDRFVQRRAYPRHLAGAHAVYVHALWHALRLPDGHAVGRHLGHRGDDRAVHAQVPSHLVNAKQALGSAPPDLCPTFDFTSIPPCSLCLALHAHDPQ